MTAMHKSVRGKERARRTLVFALVPLLLVITLTIGQVGAIPPLPHEFFGVVVLGASYAPPGTAIEVLDPQGAVCGRYVLREPGFYGYLSCRGDDPSTPSDEGAIPGDRVVFAVNGERVNTTAIPWQSGAFREVNLLLGPEQGLRLIREPARTTSDISSGLSEMLMFAAVFAVLTGSAAWLVLSRHEERVRRR